MVSQELTWGNTGATLTELNAWSLEALQFVPCPALEITRAGALVALGRPEEARVVLTPLLDLPLDPTNAMGCRAFLALAARALDDPGEDRLWQEAKNTLGGSGLDEGLQGSLGIFEQLRFSKPFSASGGSVRPTHVTRAGAFVGALALAGVASWATYML